EAANNGMRVHLYGFGWDSMSSALRHACDTTTILDPREDFQDCMEIQDLEGPISPVVPESTDDESSSSDELPARDEYGARSEVEAPFSSTPLIHTEEPAEESTELTSTPTPAPTATPAPKPRPTPAAVPTSTPNPDPPVLETPSEPDAVQAT